MNISFAYCRHFRKSISFSLLIVFLFFFACKKDPVHRVDPELNPYLQQFIQEANLRGVSLNIEDDGIIMEFADLEPPTIGLCHYSLPRRIQIDRSYWQETQLYPHGQNLRENVVFHELGHGFLNRRHDNTTLSNTEWKSMMCGGETVNNRNWAVNFNGYRKSYYLDELFNVQTPEREWSKKGVFDGLEEFPVRAYSFDMENYEGDLSGLSGSVVYKVEDGLYSLSSLSASNTLFSLYSADLPDNFYLEVNMKISLDGGAITGVFAGYKKGREEDHNYFSFSFSKRTNITNTQCYYPFAEVLVDSKYKDNQINKFAISKKGEELFFYLNDELVYRNDYELEGYNRLGVIVPAYGSLSIRDYTVYLPYGESLRTITPDTEVPYIYELSVPGKNHFK
jgi:hypothetical protein